MHVMERLRKAQEEAEVRARQVEAERRRMGREVAAISHDPLEILRSRYWPVRPDGSFDVLAYGRALDERRQPWRRSPR